MCIDCGKSWEKWRDLGCDGLIEDGHKLPMSIPEKEQYKSQTGHMFLEDDKDMVNHPPHYKQYEGFEVIDITKQMDFLTGNAVKYILRAPFKGTTQLDYEKAIWYLKKKLEEL